MIRPQAMFDILEVLGHRGFDEVEVHHKKGRSRSYRYRLGAESSALRLEEGWAVRAGDRRRSFFYAASGPPDAETSWPEADGQGLRLPPAQQVPTWASDPTLQTPLISEGEARGIFESLVKELDRELPGARLTSGHLEDGASESRILSSRGISATSKQRTAVLYLEASGPRQSTGESIEIASRDARWSITSLARRLADRILISQRDERPSRDRGEVLLSPPVVIALLNALSRLWLGPDSASYRETLVNRQGRIGSRALTLIDNGRLPGGVLNSPVDGEGLATREVVLIEEGVFRQPLLAWWQASEGNRASGCSRRASWRDVPEPGPTHLFLKPDAETSVASLLGSLSRGYYLLGVDGAVKLDPAGHRFALPVSGFSIEGGRATGSISKTWLTSSVQALLGGMLAVARDLTFEPSGNGMVGAPSVLVKGMELRSRP